MTTAITMAWEAGRIGGDIGARRMRLAQAVLRHRVLPQDPLVVDDAPLWLPGVLGLDQAAASAPPVRPPGLLLPRRSTASTSADTARAEGARKTTARSRRCRLAGGCARVVFTQPNLQGDIDEQPPPAVGNDRQFASSGGRSRASLRSADCPGGKAASIRTLPRAVDLLYEHLGAAAAMVFRPLISGWFGRLAQKLLSTGAARGGPSSRRRR